MVNSARIKHWFLAARPKTLWAAIAPVIIGTAAAFESGGLHWPSALVALGSAVMIQIGTNLANDYFDYKKGTDQSDRLGPTRVTQAGLIPPETVQWAMIMTFSLALMGGVYLAYRGGWPIVIIGIASILLGVLYTAGPFSLSYTGLADVFVLIFFGPVAVAGTYYVQTLAWSWPVILAGFAPGLFSTAILTVNNLRDIKTDARAGKRSLAVRFGAPFARAEYAVTMVLGSLWPLWFIYSNGVHPWTLIASMTIMYALPLAGRAYRTEGAALNDVLAGTGKLLALYAVLFSIGWTL